MKSISVQEIYEKDEVLHEDYKIPKKKATGIESKSMASTYIPTIFCEWYIRTKV